MHRFCIGTLLTLSLVGCTRAQEAPNTAATDVKEAQAPSLPSVPLGKGGPSRNVFVEAGLDAALVEQRLREGYQSLFHGDPKSEAIFFSAGSDADGPLAYLMDVGNGDVRSEGMSYGMWIALQFDQKADFDALWNWSRKFMYHEDRRHPNAGYFSWQMKTDGTPIDEMPAPDGEEYFAMALLMAEHRWGKGQGIFDYGSHAQQLLSDMVHREELSGPCNACKNPNPRVTSLFHPTEHQVRFTPDMGNFESNADHTDPSYHLPAFYELFALWGPEADQEFWRTAAKKSRTMFPKFAHPATGLFPDYATFDGKPFAASWDAGTVNFRFDAWRVAMNIAVDYAWWGADRSEVDLINRLQAFFEREGIKMYGNQYALDGKKLGAGRSSGLMATNATASLAADHPRAYDFVREFVKVKVPTGQWRYYDGCLYLMSWLYLSGTAKIHWPAATPATAAASVGAP